ncbi:hypothetical protein Angca_000165, partial [Angiostrongylus cantonensis]
SRGYVARPQVADRGLIADQKRLCFPETQVDPGDGLPVSAAPIWHILSVFARRIHACVCGCVLGR